MGRSSFYSNRPVCSVILSVHSVDRRDIFFCQLAFPVQEGNIIEVFVMISLQEERGAAMKGVTGNRLALFLCQASFSKQYDIVVIGAEVF